MNNKALVISVIVIVVVLLGGWYLFNQNNSQTSTTQTENTDNTQNTTNNENVVIDSEDPDAAVQIEVSVPKTHQVVYSDSGYAPAELTIKKGDTVTFKNQSSGD